jgi:uncharacterized protein
MRPAFHVLTLGVADLERALRFYRDGLGFPSEGIIATEYPGDETNAAGAIAMFHLDGGLILSLYPRAELAKDSRIPPSPPSSVEFSIGHAVRTRDEVDQLITDAQDAGATITNRPHDRPWGIYSGYFQDPDGHLWEILWNPELALRND